MPAGLSPVHLMVIFVVALIVLGPDKMPEAMRKGGRLLGEARAWSARISAELQSTVSSFTQEPVSSAPELPSTGPEASDYRPAQTPAVEPAPPPGAGPRSKRDSADLDPTTLSPTGSVAADHLPDGSKEPRS